MRGKHHILLALLLAGLLFAGVAWAQKGPDDSPFQGNQNKAESQFLQPYQPCLESGAGTQDSQTGKGSGAPTAKMDRNAPTFKQSSLSIESKPAAEQSSTEYGVPPKPIKGVTAGGGGPSARFGSPQSSKSASTFDGLLMNSLKEEKGTRKSVKEKVEGKKNTKRKD